MKRVVAVQLVVTCWALLWGAAALAAAQQAVPPGDYDALIDRALQASAAERWREAYDYFDRAHQLNPNARTLRARGVALYQLGELHPALEDLRAALQAQTRPLTPELRAAVEALVTRIEAELARVWPRPTPAGAELTVDGQPARLEQDGSALLSPGTHRLRFTAAGHAPIERELTLSAGSSTNLIVELPPRAAQTKAPERRPPPATTAVPRQAPSLPPQPDRLQPAPRRERIDAVPLWIAGGAAVAFVGVAAGLGLAGQAEVRSVRDACRQTMCSPEQREERIGQSDIRLYEDLSNASLVASGVSLLSLGALYLLLPRRPAAPVDVATGLEGIQLGGRF